MIATAPPDRRARGIVAALLVCYLLVAFRWQGISFYDDTLYMYFGRGFHLREFLYGIDTNPLYCLWFKVLGFLVHDAIVRYMVSWGLLVIVVGCLPLLMRLRLAWLYALILVCVPFFSTLTYVSFFASIFPLVGLGLVLRRRASFAGALVLCCMFCFITAYARPEFAYGCFLSGAAALVALALDAVRGNRRRAIACAALVVALCGLVAISTAHSRATRSGYAFAQHYNYRAVTRGDLVSDDPWSSEYAYRVFHLPSPQGGYGEQTIANFYHANPALFVAEIRRNVTDVRALCLFFAIFFVAAWPWLYARDRVLRPASLFALFASVPIMISSSLIFPRPHYAVIIVPMLLAMALQILAEHNDLKPPVVWPVVLGALAIMLLESSLYNRHRRDFDSVIRSNIASLRCVRTAERQRGLHGPILDTEMIEAEDVYFDTNRTRIDPFTIPDWQRFQQTVAHVRPSWVVTGPQTTGRYGASPLQIANTLSQLGYQPYACESSRVVVYTDPSQH